MYKYKTKNGLDCVIPGVGATVDGTIDSPVIIENPSLQLINDVAAQPAPVQAQPVTPENKETL